MIAPLGRLTRRVEFLAVARGRRSAMPGLVLQARRREAGGADPATMRVGYTVTRKIGNAVERNRVRRRLRQVAREILPDAGQPGHDYVLVGRRSALVRPFTDLKADLAAALARLGASGRVSAVKP
jgi:ribonuclease P protein component